MLDPPRHCRAGVAAWRMAELARKSVDDVGSLAGADHPQPPRLGLDDLRVAQCGAAREEAAVVGLQARDLRLAAVGLAHRAHVGDAGPDVEGEHAEEKEQERHPADAIPADGAVAKRGGGPCEVHRPGPSFATRDDLPAQENAQGTAPGSRGGRTGSAGEPRRAGATLGRVSYETAAFQWDEGLRRLRAAPPELRPVLDRVVDRIVAELRRRLGGRFTTGELVDLYGRGTDWAVGLAVDAAPETPAAWDAATVADAAFARYVREAADYAGGRRLEV